MKDKLLAALRDWNDTIDFEKESSLVTGGVIDSLEWAEMIEQIELAFSVEIPMERMLPESFDSLEAMIGLLDDLIGERS